MTRDCSTSEHRTAKPIPYDITSRSNHIDLDQSTSKTPDETDIDVWPAVNIRRASQGSCCRGTGGRRSKLPQGNQRTKRLPADVIRRTADHPLSCARMNTRPETDASSRSKQPTPRQNAHRGLTQMTTTLCAEAQRIERAQHPPERKPNANLLEPRPLQSQCIADEICNQM